MAYTYDDSAPPTGFNTVVEQGPPGITYLLHNAARSCRHCVAGPIGAPPPKRIIDGRINHLETEIRGFEDQTDKLLGGG